jgi:uncharacterized protein YegP (UPF0339 family)
MADYVEMYQDAADEWRWHRKAANHEIVSESGEGYVDFTYARERAEKLNPHLAVKVRRNGDEIIDASDPTQEEDTDGSSI